LKALELHTELCFVPSSHGWDGILRQAASAGRFPRAGPGPLGRDRFTLRRDLNGHGGLDVMGDDLPSASAALVGSCGVPPGRAARRVRVRGSTAPVPAACVGTCGDALLGPRPGRDVIDQTVLDPSENKAAYNVKKSCDRKETDSFLSIMWVKFCTGHLP
jgi:hypothetical protein